MSLLNQLVDEPAETGISPDKSPTDFETLRKKIFGGGNKSSAVSAKRKATTEKEEIANDAEKLFQGENWEEISGLYFQARYAMTGYDGFLLTPPQKKALGTTLAATMKLLMKIDPGYIAAITFTTTFVGLVGSKELTYHHLQKKEAAKHG